MNSTPMYKHDCKNCKYLGAYQNADLYFCPGTIIPTLLARFSDGPSDCSSVRLNDFVNYGIGDFFIEARRRASLDGYLMDEVYKRANDLEKPRYKNTCLNCKFLGLYNEYDLYYCSNDMGAMFIAKYDNMGNSYLFKLVNSSSEISTPELEEAKRRAINLGYVNEPVKGETKMEEENYKHMILTQYIKDKKTGKKVGMIQAIKVNHRWFNETCVSSAFHKTKPFVVIVHSKVRPGCGDIFNFGRAEEITNSKCEFMMDVLSGRRQRRQKYVEEMPIKDTLNYYKDMYERARRYYKDCDEIVQYHEVFDFVEYNDLEENLENLLDKYKNESFISVTETFTKPCKEGCSCKKE